MKQGGVSSRVALLLRSTEPQPSLLDLSFHVCVCVCVCFVCVVPLPLANGDAVCRSHRPMVKPHLKFAESCLISDGANRQMCVWGVVRLGV